MKKYYISISIVVFLLLAASAGLFFWVRQESSRQRQDYSDKISTLEKQLSSLKDQISATDKTSADLALSTKELANREALQQKAQKPALTAAVEKAVPAVVSIVVSRNVPQYEVVYENPFGNDPNFRDFNVRVPVYRPTGDTKSRQVGAGTGFLINAQGYILTNKHVVAGANDNYTVLLSDGKQVAAQVVYSDQNQDIAVVKISGTNYPFLTLGDSNSLELGQTVVAIGNALGQYNNSVSVGVISGLNRDLQVSGGSGAETLSGVIQTDASINPGNSGGPLLNVDGRVVGINVATVLGSNSIGFSIPINTVKGIVEKVLSNNK